MKVTRASAIQNYKALSELGKLPFRKETSLILVKLLLKFREVAADYDRFIDETRKEVFGEKEKLPKDDPAILEMQKKVAQKLSENIEIKVVDKISLETLPEDIQISPQALLVLDWLFESEEKDE